MLLTVACPSLIQRPFAFARTGGTLLRRRVSREVADPALVPFPSVSPLPSTKFWAYAKKRAFTLIPADLDTSADVIGAKLGRKRRLLLFLADACERASMPRLEEAQERGGSDIEKNSFLSVFYAQTRKPSRRRVGRGAKYAGIPKTWTFPYRPIAADERVARAHVYIVIAVTSLDLLTFVVISFAAIGTKVLSDAWNYAVHYSLDEASRLVTRVFIRAGDRRPDLWPGIKRA